MKERSFSLILAGLLGLPFNSVAHAQVPQRLSISVHLTYVAGAAVTGRVDATLSLYTGAEGGAPAARETFEIDTESGHFAVELGRASSIDLATIAAGVYLGIQIDDDPEMQLRLPFNASMYAQQAYRAERR